MGIIAWIVLGAIAGSIARRLAGVNDLPFGFTTGLGILGAVVGGALANRILGHDSVNGFWDASTWATAIVGAIVVIAIARLLHHPARRRS